MSLLVGVMCNTCGKFIKYGEQRHRSAFADEAPLDPHICNACKCGASHTYDCHELVDELAVPFTYRPTYPQYDGVFFERCSVLNGKELSVQFSSFFCNNVGVDNSYV